MKLYTDKDNNLKGGGLVSYLKPESVENAIDVLNESEIKPGFKIKIDMAKFEQKGEYHPRQSYKIDHLEKYHRKTKEQRELGWNEEEDEKGLKIIIIKNMFSPSDLAVALL